MAKCAKKRNYSDDYLKYGFTVISKNSFDMPQCVISFKILRPMKKKLLKKWNTVEIG